MVMTWNYPKRKYKRSYLAYKRRKYAYRKRKYARKSAISRMSVNHHRFRRFGLTTAYNFANPNTSIDQAFSFALDKIVGYTEFTSLYDQYRIRSVTMTIRFLNVPEANSQIGVTTIPNPMNIYPRIWFITDRDDATAESWTAIKERSIAKFRTMNPRKDVKIYVRPTPLMQLYRTDVTTGYATNKRCWIDCSQPNVPHYGIKWSIEIGGFTPVNLAPYSFTVDTCYIVEFKNTR